MVGIASRSGWLIGRPANQLVLVVAAAMVGAFSVWATSALIEPSGTLFIMCACMAVALGISKTATACGLNVIADLATVARPVRIRVSGSLVFGASALAVATSLGIILSIAFTPLRSQLSFAIASPLILFAGLLELGILGRHPAITLPWQVPAEWVRRRRFASVTWGLLLGTGLTTYMPHPSFYALLAMAALLPFPSGALLMSVYGLSRASPCVVTAAQRSDWLLEKLQRDALAIRLSGHVFAGAASCVLFGAIVGVLFT